MIDHRSYTHNENGFERAWTGFESTTSAILVQCSTNWAICDELPLMNAEDNIYVITDFFSNEFKQYLTG